MIFDQVYSKKPYNFIIPKKVYLTVKTTNFCPNFCDFCCMDSNLKGDSLDLNLVKKLIEDIKDNNTLLTRISLTGGEPLFNEGIIDFLKWVKENKELILSDDGFIRMNTSGVDPSSSFAKIYESRLKECINNCLLDALYISYSKGIKPAERIKKLDEILHETNAFSKLKFKPELYFVDREYNVEEAPVIDRSLYFLYGFNAINSGRKNKTEFKPTYSVCYITGNYVSEEPTIMMIDEHGSVLPCCAVESFISKTPPYADIKIHDFRTICRRGNQYTDKIKGLLKELRKKEHYMDCIDCGVKVRAFFKKMIN